MADRLTSLRRRADALPVPVLDTAIAVLCYLATVALPVKAGSAGWSLFVLAALASLPLVWRRQAPIATAALVGAGTVGLALTGALDGIPLPYGQLVATYTVAVLAAPLWRSVAMVATAVGVVVVVLPVLEQGSAMLGAAAVPFVVAYALGTGVRARRDRIEMLEERARRVAEQQHATAARERERIAREIHDIVAHSVSIMVVQAEAGLVLAAGQDRIETALDAISGTGREALDQLHRALGVLRGGGAPRHPQPGLDGIPALVEQARGAGLDASLTEVGQVRPAPADLATAAYRLVQEAVTNTIRHAHARRLSVRLDWRDTALHVEVADEGRGPSSSDGSGHGLIGMRERVTAFGGRLRTGAGEGGVGFRVSADLPTGSQRQAHA